jgi:tRNA dimethylallyltransferase
VPGAVLSFSSPIVITGPTASGKGAVAHELARRIGGEIVCMDSMKIYREIDIATAKPSPERRAEIPYHLLDIVDPDVDFSVAEYLRILEDTLAALAARRKPAVIVGGTALYLKGYVDGFREGPPADWAVRTRLLEEARTGGAEALHLRLAAVDPVAATKIHVRDVRRIVRALEVVETTGRSISSEWRWGTAPRGGSRAWIFGLARERSELYARVDRRVLGMVERGLFEEALRLKVRIPPLSRSAAQAIGCKEIWEGTEQGRSREEIVASVQQETRRFAKRQWTWFRKLPIEWLEVDAEATTTGMVDEVLRRLESRAESGSGSEPGTERGTEPGTETGTDAGTGAGTET